MGVVGCLQHAPKQLSPKCPVANHEYTHNVIYKLYGNHFIEPVLSEKDTEAAAMDEAFADYFTASKKNDPLIGEATPLPQRDVDNDFDMSYWSTWNGDPNRAQLRGQIISGAVWELRGDQWLWYFLGQPSNFPQIIDQTAYYALWLSPHPTTFTGYALNFVDALDAHGHPSFDPINDTFCGRGIDTGECSAGKTAQHGPERSERRTERTGVFFSAYPNPFNPEINVQIQVGERQPVRIGIYDLLGREVAELFNGDMENGKHTVTFDGASFPSGIYLLRLRTASDVQIGHIILQK